MPDSLTSVPAGPVRKRRFRSRNAKPRNGTLNRGAFIVIMLLVIVAVIFACLTMVHIFG